MAKTSSREDLSQTVMRTLTQEQLQTLSPRQANLIQSPLDRRIKKPEPVTEAEILGMYELVTEEVLPASL